MKRMIPVLLALLLLAGCGGGEETALYRQISQEEAKKMMDTQEVIILDVREQDEYDSGHIPGAVLLPVGTVDEDAAAAVKILGGGLERVQDYEIPGTDIRHRVVVIKKLLETPKKYPRAFAKMKKNPL